MSGLTLNNGGEGATSPLPENYESDALILADLIRECSAEERLITKADLLPAFVEKLRAVQIEQAMAEAEAKQSDGPAGTHEEGVAGALDSGLSRRDLLTSIIGIRQRYLDKAEQGDGETSGSTLQSEASVATKDGDASVSDSSSIDLPVREITSEYFESVLALAMTGGDDLAVLEGLDGEEYYHCRHLMSATYAKILTGKSSPCLLIAETVRENSKLYPRPVAIEVFEYPPFDMKPEEIESCMRILAGSEDTNDIQYVESSVGTIYLYSGKYLEKDYAAFIAEQQDLGMITSP